MSVMATNSLKRERSPSPPTKSPFTVTYTIFMYREELRKRNNHFMKLSKVKIHLTDTLICNTIRNIGQYDVREVMNINEQMLFKKRLHNKMHKIRKLEKLGVKDIDPNCLSYDF